MSADLKFRVRLAAKTVAYAVVLMLLSRLLGGSGDAAVAWAVFAVVVDEIAELRTAKEARP